MNETETYLADHQRGSDLPGVSLHDIATHGIDAARVKSAAFLAATRHHPITVTGGVKTFTRPTVDSPAHDIGCAVQSGIDCDCGAGRSN